MLRSCLCATVVALMASAPRAGAQTPLTLDAAMHEARAHNARLPVAALDTAIAHAAVGEARGRLWPDLGIGGDIHGGTPSRYASGDARLQVLLGVPLYRGGALRADVGRAQAEQALTLARYRIAERDLDYTVRLAFAQTVALERELALRREGLGRLNRYVDLVAARQRSGEPVAGDLLKARVQQDRQEAELERVQRQHAVALLEMKELLGRNPADTLQLAPLMPPAPPALAEAEPWAASPEIQAAEASERRAAAVIRAVRAERLPHLDLALNAGTQPVLGSSFDAPLNTGRGTGAEVTLSLSWPLWDRGVYRARLAQAQLASRQATDAASVARRDARLAWNLARADLVHLYREIQVRQRAVPTAEDAYLQAESLYHGGSATSLEVLDAFSQWIQAALDATWATLDYRIAEAQALRWGTP